MIHRDEENGSSNLSKGSTVSLSELSTTTCSSNLSLGDVVHAHENDVLPTFKSKTDESSIYETLKDEGYNYPVEVFIRHFNWNLVHSPLQRRKRIQSFCELSAKENLFQKQQFKQRLSNIHLQVLDQMMRDVDSWCAFIYLLAGLLLMTAIFLGDFIEFQILRNMLLAVSISYGACSGRGVVHMILVKWHRLHSNENWIQNEFRKVFLEKSSEYYHSKNAYCTSCKNQYTDNANVIHPYILSIFSHYGTFESLSLSQLHRMILEEMEVVLTQQELVMTFSNLDYLQDGKITPGEFFLYLSNVPKKISRFERVQKVLYDLCTDRIWLATLFFLIGSSMSACNNILKRYSINLATYLGMQSPSIMISIFFVLGTLGFTYHDYHGERELYYLKHKVQRQLHYFLSTTKYYGSTSMNDHNSLETGFTKREFRLFLDNSNIIISDSAYLNIFQSIQTDKNLIDKGDIAEFLSSKTFNTQNLIFKKCFANFMFLANFIWFIGAVGFLISAYSTMDNTEGIWNAIGDRVGATGYFLGSVLYFIELYRRILLRLQQADQLYDALEEIL